MTKIESQRRPVPFADGGELDTALAFLGFARESVRKKTEGLGEEELRRVLVPTGTNLLGLVRHLTAAERYWFGHHVAGLAEYEDVDFGMAVPADVPADRVLADYREACADSDAIVRAAAGPDAPTATPVGPEPRSLRWVLAHMTGETARHAGHADILREQLDGTTGR
ncbi:DinB family protein [Kitasatospora sp. NA04385]|uniref:DinB family protein n=1 Tax=Kitasatospora sp. NA04385 TaxID=2742135 RepID=UPI0015920753|nr:DinB family protein [Kitasatospora sp. NA04385]QKW19050.1 DinB family protein [Kitasatospora sp. NA04385]